MALFLDTSQKQGHFAISIAHTPHSEQNVTVTLPKDSTHHTPSFSEWPRDRVKGMSSRLQAIRDRADAIDAAEEALAALIAKQKTDVVEAIHEGDSQKDVVEAARRTREWVRRLQRASDSPTLP